MLPQVGKERLHQLVRTEYWGYARDEALGNEALIAERGSDEKIWGSLVKTTMQRRKPGFTESYYGYRSFKELVEDAEKHKLLMVIRDEKSGQYTIKLPAAD